MGEAAGYYLRLLDDKTGVTGRLTSGALSLQQMLRVMMVPFHEKDALYCTTL